MKFSFERLNLLCVVMCPGPGTYLRERTKSTSSLSPSCFQPVCTCLAWRVTSKWAPTGRKTTGLVSPLSSYDKSLYTSLCQKCVPRNLPPLALDIKYYTLHLSFPFVLQYADFLPDIIIFQHENILSLLLLLYNMTINENSCSIEREERHWNKLFWTRMLAHAPSSSTR